MFIQLISIIRLLYWYFKIEEIVFMIAGKEVEDAHVGGLTLLGSLATLGDFRSSLELLYSFKHHYVGMKDLLERAVYRNKKEKKLSLEVAEEAMLLKNKRLDLYFLINYSLFTYLVN